MVARGPDDRPDLKALAPLVLKALRQLRGVSPAEMARKLGISLRAYENFESGKGRLNVDRIHAFAALLEVDPFAILAAFEIDSPDFALHSANNKIMMIFFMNLRAFATKAGPTVARLDPLTLMDAFSAMFDDLTLKAQAQEDVVTKLTSDDEPSSPEADPKPEDREPDDET